MIARSLRVAVTGALGTVGRRTLRRLRLDGHDVVGFDRDSRSARRAARRLGVEIRFGDIRRVCEVEELVAGCDAVVHLAAVIPPLAHRDPGLSYSVNVEGTRVLTEAMNRRSPQARLIFTSSVAVFGDRRHRPLILEDETPGGFDGDCYAYQKTVAEGIVRSSGLEHTILRLTYIVDETALVLDPLMFRMPLETPIEICHSRDVARAISSALTSSAAAGQTLHIAGGPACRTDFRAYLDAMLPLFGLGRRPLPAAGFSRRNFHCGHMETRESQSLLAYQRIDLAGFLRRVQRRMRGLRLLVSLVRPLARWWIVRSSPKHRQATRRRRHAGEVLAAARSGLAESLAMAVSALRRATAGLRLPAGFRRRLPAG